MMPLLDYQTPEERDEKETRKTLRRWENWILFAIIVTLLALVLGFGCLAFVGSVFNIGG
jgi:hypothetical protein